MFIIFCIAFYNRFHVSPVLTQLGNQ
ncbi:hypothetical protein MASSI9I_60401 [Massilia sp. 9I]|nr:hypothetical protein MASSI9I_60401 [Massilia sp. 9I]